MAITFPVTSDPDETGKTVVDLVAPTQVIASLIGVKPETLSRLLHKLTDQGYIEMRDHQLVVKDIESLRTAGLH